ncbi:DUF6087 family protein [Streptomyces noursei]|uniref:DUF6087 family protein n=1 Tax=Streptomyces noursei TaxID=1971 RepID=UPI001C72088C|nr:DUF6087 family protein [Streptomyces noursei]
MNAAGGDEPAAPCWHVDRPWGGHLNPDEPRALEAWDDCAHVPAGTADDLAAAQERANGTDPGGEGTKE